LTIDIIFDTPITEIPIRTGMQCSRYSLNIYAILTQVIHSRLHCYLLHDFPQLSSHISCEWKSTSKIIHFCDKWEKSV